MNEILIVLGVNILVCLWAMLWVLLQIIEKLNKNQKQKNYNNN